MLEEIKNLFSIWMKVKISIHVSGTKKLFKECEIWWVSIGMNIGDEIFGKGDLFTRPVLVFKKFTSNSFLGIPLTSQEKQGTWYIHVRQGGKVHWVILNQARILDARRLRNRIGTLDDVDKQRVQTAFRDLFCPIK